MLGQTVIRFMCLPLIAKIVDAKHVYTASFVVTDTFIISYQISSFRKIFVIESSISIRN